MSGSGIKIVETRMSKIYWEDEKNGILISEVKPKLQVTIDDLKENFEVYKNNFHHSNRKLLIDNTEINSFGKEGRDYFAGPEGIYNYFNAVAFLSYSKYSIGSIIAHVALKVYVLRKPTKLFHNKKDAISWLMSVN